LTRHRRKLSINAQQAFSSINLAGIRSSYVYDPFASKKKDWKF
jgi:hypothetical protein